MALKSSFLLKFNWNEKKSKKIKKRSKLKSTINNWFCLLNLNCRYIAYNLDGLKSESSTIRFRNPNCLSLKPVSRKNLKGQEGAKYQLAPITVKNSFKEVTKWALTTNATYFFNVWVICFHVARKILKFEICAANRKHNNIF